MIKQVEIHSGIGFSFSHFDFSGSLSFLWIFSRFLFSLSQFLVYRSL